MHRTHTRKLARATVALALTIGATVAAAAPAEAARGRDLKQRPGEVVATTSGGKVFRGKAFDTCEAPSIVALQAWRASPYGALGIYSSGSQRACKSSRLTADWVRRVHAQGWEFLPIHVGLQAPCSGASKKARMDPTRAAELARAEADEAVDSAARLGFKEGSAVYLDMEAYGKDPGCREAVLNFTESWVKRVHERNWKAGYYSSLTSGIADMVRAVGRRAILPDVIWYARWDGKDTITGDGAIPGQYWTQSQRIHQYNGNVKETYNGVTINIDRNRMDAPVGVL